RLALGKLREERAQVVEVGRDVEAVGLAAGAPAHVPRHGLVPPQLAAQLRELERFAHVHVSCAATLPIEPAPMVTTTSPSRAERRIASGRAVMSSMNCGSTWPATRSARASERPSAATIGDSPAA